VLLLCSSDVQKRPFDERYDRILHTVGQLLAQGHYSPQAINDQFSAKIYSAYLKQMDPEKAILLQADIKELQAYQTLIDDEIQRTPVDFFYKFNTRYKQRLTEIKASLPKLTEKPFDFTKHDSLVTEYDKRTFASNAKTQQDYWQQKLKFVALEKLIDLQEQRDKASAETPKETDVQLEVRAREFARTTLDKSLDRFLNKTSDDDRFSVFVTTITNMMDPHTDFFMPVEKRSWDEKLSGKFYGIGALIGETNGYLQISSVSPGGPAWKTGEVNDGDFILKIAEGDKEPVDVMGYDIPDGVKLIRGDKGTTVKLTLKKTDGTVKVVSIVREELKLEETFAKGCLIKDGGQKTGYIYLPKFYTPMGDEGGRSCAADLAAEITKLQAENIEGLIIDLRDNGGGSLYEVVQMVGLFIPSGPVVQVKNGDGRVSFLPDEDNGRVHYSGPLVVMVNEFSASASEIFAAAIQDYKRGLIVGSSSTYGKGTVQRPIPLSRLTKEEDTDLGTVHLTIQKYYRVNGSSTQLKGVEPDLVLPGYYENYKIREKDNKSALAWDEIRKLSYTTWSKAANLDQLRQRFQQRMDSTNVLSKIRENSAWLAAQQDAALDLNLNAYKEREKLVNERAKQARALLVLSHEMDVTRIGAETAANTSPSTASYNTRWLNYLKKDRYLYEANRVVADMIEGLNKAPVTMKN
jgi:carboxyl-terminal processing protease